MTNGAVSVMVVEDEPEFRELVATVLDRTGGYEVWPAALDRWVEDARDAAPDVVLLDLALDGVDAVAHIPALLAACPTTMVAALTGLPAEDRERATLSAGAFVYYEKRSVARLPAHLEEDLALFRRALAGEDVVAPSAAVRRRPSSGSPTLGARDH